MTKFNLAPIRKGDTFTNTFVFWSDDAKTIALNVSTWSFKLMAKNSAGVTQFTWTNTDFVSSSSNTRTLTLSSATTTGYTAGEYSYDLQVTYPDASQKTLFYGYITVQDQITS